MIASAVNWTQVILALIAAIPATIAALAAVANRRSLRTPSGDAIGHVVERTHDLAAVSSLAVSGVTASGGIQDSARRLNADGGSPVKVNGEIMSQAGPSPPPDGQHDAAGG